MTEPSNTGSAGAIKSALPSSANGSGEMFNGIAARYDFVNRVMSFGMDRRWRNRLVSSLSTSIQKNDDAVLDLATGTGDVALAIAGAYPHIDIRGLDPSVGMLKLGREKVSRAGLSERIRLDEGDAQSMPYADNSFAASCISFGIRNVPDRLQGLREMSRVTRSGGRVAILELSEPTGFMGPFARFHVHHVVPTLGALLSGQREYRYLQNSIETFPEAEVFAEIMTSAGLRNVELVRMSFGAVHLYLGDAP